MSGKEETLELEDDLVADDAGEAGEIVEARAEVAKTNLTKRRIIDNLLEERRLSKQLAEYDFDL
jgi:hypothetical protein